MGRSSTTKWKDSPGTIISYLTSLEKFLRFITSRLYDFKSMPPLHPNYRVLFRDLIPSLKGWRATVDASTQDRQVHRYIDECDAMITMKEMQQVKQSEPYTDGERYLLDASEGKKLTFEEFALVRDLLLVKFALLTSTQPAPLNNAVLGDFQTAGEERGKRIILVPKHKRSKDRPAMLGMNQELQRDMAIYVQKIRPHFANPDEDKIFVKDDGYGFKKGTIGRRLTEFFCKDWCDDPTSIAYQHLQIHCNKNHGRCYAQGG